MIVNRDISHFRVREIRAVINELMKLRDWDELAGRFVEAAHRLVPGDCHSWNVFDVATFGYQGCAMTEDYMPLHSMTGPRLDTFLPFHPVVERVGWDYAEKAPARLSDFQPVGDFRRRNPLFDEVYRHLDAHYQLVYTIGNYGDQKIILSLNRRASDFSEEDRTTLYLLSRQLDGHLSALHRLERVEQDLSALEAVINGRLEAPCAAAQFLTAGELETVRLLQKGAREALRPSHRRRALARVREKFGLENNRQLLAAWREAVTG